MRRCEVDHLQQQYSCANNSHDNNIHVKTKYNQTKIKQSSCSGGQRAYRGPEGGFVSHDRGVQGSVGYGGGGHVGGAPTEVHQQG